MGRSHFSYRKGLVFRDATECQAKLKTLSAAGTEFNRPDRSASRTAFMYPDQGNQWVGMGEALYSTEPVFRAVLDQCDLLLRAERDTSLLDVMFGRSGAGDGDLNDPAWAQPAIYALEVALTALWESVGIRPDTVLGQGIGEVAAAQVSGALVREDGMRLAASLTGPDVALYRNTPAPPERTWVSSVTGRVVPPSEVRDNAYW